MITHLNIADRQISVPDGVKLATVFYNPALEAVVDGLRSDIDTSPKTARMRPEPVAHHVAMSPDIGPSTPATFTPQVVYQDALAPLSTSLRSCARPGQNRPNLRKEMCASTTT